MVPQLQGLAALSMAACLLAASPGGAQTVRCSPEVDQALARANGAPQQRVAAELDRALAVLDEAVGDDASAECHHLLGFALKWRADAGGVPEEVQRAMRALAVRELGTAVSKNPSDVRAWELKAEAEEDAGLSLQAAGTYASLARAHPGHAYAPGARVRLLAKAGKLEDALTAAREWVGARPGEWEAHLSLGLRLEELGQAEAAIAAYATAASLDEGIDTAPLRLGGLLARLGRWKQAEEAFAKVDAMEYLLGWYSQGVCRVKQGDMKGARAWVAKLKAEEGGGALARRLKALLKSPGVQPVLGLAAYAEP
jgi:tetratricopeptide (TPR) repeat protein